MQKLSCRCCMLKLVCWGYRRPLDASSLAEGSVRTSRAGDHASLISRLALNPRGFAGRGLSPRVLLRPGRSSSSGITQGRHMGRRLMANAEKTAVIEDLAGKFRDSSGAVLTEYRGLTVAQMSELRGSLKGNATFSVTKNTLAKVAATEAGLGDQVSPMLSG